MKYIIEVFDNNNKSSDLSVIDPLKKLLLLIFILPALLLSGQIGGTRTYRFLDIPMTARAAGLGGSSMPIWGDDINLLHSNAGSLNPGMLKQAAFNYCNFVGDVNYYSLAYAYGLKKAGTAAITIQAFNYGSFVGYDEIGEKTTNFKASDYSINLHYAKPLADSMFNIGVALKTIISQYDIYNSIGNAVDFGIVYHNKKDFTLSLLARNVGVMWKTYSVINGSRESLPATTQFGISKKVAKAPFRLFLVYDQLLKWKVGYVSPIDTAGKISSLSSSSETDTTGFERFTINAGNFTDNLMRHITLGTEILITKNFNLRIAYNYRRQKEFTLPDRRGASAFSFGFGLRVKRFGFSYAFSKMAAPGNSHLIGLTFGW